MIACRPSQNYVSGGLQLTVEVVLSEKYRQSCSIQVGKLSGLRSPVLLVFDSEPRSFEACALKFGKRSRLEIERHGPIKANQI